MVRVWGERGLENDATGDRDLEGKPLGFEERKAVAVEGAEQAIGARTRQATLSTLWR